MLDTSVYERLQFKYPFRHYQKLILEKVKNSKGDDKYHIVAPPGSGKTIVGIELIRRLKAPAVIFAPTTTIQAQWKEKISMFIPDDSGLHIDDFVSTVATDIKLINIYTYQLISTSNEGLEYVKNIARQDWVQDLIISGTCAHETEAMHRIQTMRQNNKKAYNKELSRYYKKVKRDILKDPTADRTQFLHENAKQLIQRLVNAGIKTVVMDEVHHLLDYWAIVLSQLLSSIEGEKVIGLTATPPESASNNELNNYLSIVGAIDFEVPTPAVVKEGNLAPYQDLVYFCCPTDREKRFLNSLQSQFNELLKQYQNDETFNNWLIDSVLKRLDKDGKKIAWTYYFNKHPTFSLAALRYFKQVLKVKLPGDIIDIEESDNPITLEDWVELLSTYALTRLKLSPDKKDQTRFYNIKQVLKSFGFALTERGLIKRRAPSDIVLSLSESKHNAVIKILDTEIKSMGNDIRAVVITDFEKESAVVSHKLQGILDPDAGSAVSVFHKIVNSPKTTELEPILVTGTTVLSDADYIDDILTSMEKWREENRLSFTLLTEKTSNPRVVKITGKGKDWKSSTYVRMVTALFEKGVTRCLVGTRGLLGEGWDSIRLNTLIDLTTATTSTTVNQIRGRSIRLDPELTHKVANNWDVVCVDPKFSKGSKDFERYQRKHRYLYGITPSGAIVKGLAHSNEQLFMQFVNHGFSSIDFFLINQQMLAKAKDRKKIYELWRVGDKYQNVAYSSLKLNPTTINFKTVFTLKNSLKAIFNRILFTVITTTLWFMYITGGFDPITLMYSPVTIVLVTLLLIVILVRTWKDLIKYVHLAFIEVPIDSFLLDISYALLLALRDSDLISKNVHEDNVVVSQAPNGYIDVTLDRVTKEDSQTFTQAFNELMAPVLNQRYLISRSEDSIPLGFYKPIWWVLRKLFRLVRQEKVAYHPVPNILAANRKRANIFAKYWQKYVGGGKLIYTRSTKGRKILLKLRDYNHRKIERFMFTMWK